MSRRYRSPCEWYVTLMQKSYILELSGAHEVVVQAIFAIEDALVSGRAEDTRKYILWKLGERCRKLAEFSRFNQNVCDPR